MSVPGNPGQDYPIYAQVPDTSFSCDGRVEGGYYADTEGDCQPFHVCSADSASQGQFLRAATPVVTAATIPQQELPPLPWAMLLPLRAMMNLQHLQPTRPTTLPLRAMKSLQHLQPTSPTALPLKTPTLLLYLSTSRLEVEEVRGLEGGEDD